MGADGACSLLFCVAKRSGAFPPKIPAWLRARVSRLGGCRRPFATITIIIVANGRRQAFLIVSIYALILYMNTASKLGPHTQTDRGTCPGVGL